MLGFVLLTPVLGKWGMAGMAAGAFLLNLLVLPRTPFGRSLARAGEGRWNGLVAYPLAVALGYALFDPLVAGAAWAAMATGDPAATVAGRPREGGVRIPWNRRKSAAGSLAFVVAATAGVFATALVLGSPTGPAWGGAAALAGILVVAGIAGVVGALVESIPWPADDNLPVLLAVGGALTLHVSMLH
jgi:dolichol kinase